MKDIIVIDTRKVKDVGRKGLNVVKVMTGYSLAEKGVKLLSAKTQRIEDQLKIAKQSGFEAGEKSAYQDIWCLIANEEVKSIEEIKEWIEKELRSNKESGD